ncbi:MAG: TatD family hydrolase [Rhodanobacter sp.]|jgi:TatD DNase family protein|nr:TatD family hydrolase [Rhodanobacter sp.]
MLIDSHCHLDAREFDADRTEVITRARNAGVTAQIVPAITLAGFPAVRALCAANAGLYPAYGLHPMYLTEHRPDHLDVLQDWIDRERPVAVGECGLDFFVEGLDPDLQRTYFLRQLEIAHDADLPVVLHARRAVDEVIASIRRVGSLRGVVHSYSGSEEQARQLWKLGFRIGLGGPLTYAHAKRLRALTATMPIDYLLLETDAPDQPLANHRGQRNEPAYLAHVLDTVAALRGESREVIAAATTRNAQALFGLY